VNGVRAATTTTSATVGASGDALTIGGQWFANNSGRQLQGYISNARIVRGSSAYDATQSNITVPSAPLTAITNTSLLTCQSNRFIDNSTNAYAVTAAGDASVQAFQPFPGATTWSGSVLGGSGYFDGSGDYLTTASSSNLGLGTGSFTIEFWYYANSSQGSRTILVGNNSGFTTNSWHIQLNNASPSITNRLQLWAFNLNSGAVALQGATTLVPNTWYHVALVRSGNTFTFYLNGVSDATTTSAASLDGGGANTIAIARDGTDYYAGYMTDVRILKGTAQYTTNFTPPTAPLTAITNTQLLCNFTNAGIFDSAMMNNLETVGNAQVSTSVVKYGTGSMYFDGTGDYLTLHNLLTSNLGSGPFTVELWVYFNSASGTQYVLSNYQSVTVGWALGISSGNFAFWATGDTPDISTSVAPSTGVWYHLAVSGQSGAIRMFLNGTQIGSTFTGTPALDSTATLRIGDGQGAASPQPFNGYMDDLRITKGAARYIGNFTPPVARMPQQ
jgi:hypothetical protein